MHFNTASTVVLAILGSVAAGIKIIATVKVSGARELSRTARTILVMRTIFFFLFVAAGLSSFLLPTDWQLPALQWRLFWVFLIIWAGLMIAFPVLVWKSRKGSGREQEGAKGL